MQKSYYVLIIISLLLLVSCPQTKPTQQAQAPVINTFSVTPTTGEAPLLVTFAWKIADANGDALTCKLDVDSDGSYEYTLNTCDSNTSQRHIYRGVKTYTATLLVSDGSKSVKKTQTITTKIPADNAPASIKAFAATPPVGKAPLNVTFMWNVENKNNHNLTCKLDVDNDGKDDYTIQACQAFTQQAHTYTKVGTYKAKLTISDAFNSVDSTIEVFASAEPMTPPEIRFFMVNNTLSATGYAPFKAKFHWDVYDAQGDTLTCKLDIDNDGTDDYTIERCVSMTKEHTYNTVGNHTAKLTVLDGSHPNSVAMQTVNIQLKENKAPVITSFTISTATQGTAPLSTLFQWQVSDPEGQKLTCDIDVNSDGIIEKTIDYCASDTKEYRHIFTQPGTYTPKLIVRDSYGKSTEAVLATPITATMGKTFVVNTTEDTIDVAKGDGKCADSKGKCSLRAAVMESNSTPGLDKIQLAAATYKLTRVPSENNNTEQRGDLNISDDIIIVGAGAERTIIDAAQIDRAIAITTAATLEKLAVINGKDVRFSSGGGAIYFNGGEAKKPLILRDVLLKNNQSNHGGGALYCSNSNSLQLKRVAIINNQSTDGGGVHNASCHASVEDSLFESNKAQNQDTGSGGAWYDSAYAYDNISLKIIDTIFRHNKAYIGGALFLGSLTTMERVTIANNQAKNFGGGLYIDNYYSSQNSNLFLVTLSANEAKDGGAIYIPNTSRMAGNFLTISGNKATNQGGGIHGKEADVSIRGTILSDNVAVQGAQCFGKIVSKGYNLLQSNNDCSYTIAQSDITNQSANLAALADNGGSTLTMLPNVGSPVIDMIPTSECKTQAGNVVSTDQRGKARPQGAKCDIGAVER